MSISRIVNQRTIRQCAGITGVAATWALIEPNTFLKKVGSTFAGYVCGKAVIPAGKFLIRQIPKIPSTLSSAFSFCKSKIRERNEQAATILQIDKTASFVSRQNLNSIKASDISSEERELLKHIVHQILSRLLQESELLSVEEWREIYPDFDAIVEETANNLLNDLIGEGVCNAISFTFAHHVQSHPRVSPQDLIQNFTQNPKKGVALLQILSDFSAMGSFNHFGKHIPDSFKKRFDEIAKKKEPYVGAAWMHGHSILRENVEDLRMHCFQRLFSRTGSYTFEKLEDEIEPTQTNLLALMQGYRGRPICFSISAGRGDNGFRIRTAEHTVYMLSDERSGRFFFWDSNEGFMSADSAEKLALIMEKHLSLYYIRGNITKLSVLDT